MVLTVDRERDALVDDAARGAGIWTMILTATGNVIYTPQDASIVIWLVGLVVTGLFGIASSAIAVYVKWRLDRRRELKDSAKPQQKRSE